MGRYVTPAGVEIEMGDEAARVVGYTPAQQSEPSKKDDEPKAKRQRSTSSKKSD